MNYLPEKFCHFCRKNVEAPCDKYDGKADDCANYEHPHELVDLIAKTIHDHWQQIDAHGGRSWDKTIRSTPGAAYDFREKAKAVANMLEEQGFSLFE